MMEPSAGDCQLPGTGRAQLSGKARSAERTTSSSTAVEMVGRLTTPLFDSSQSESAADAEAEIRSARKGKGHMRWCERARTDHGVDGLGTGCYRSWQ